MPKVYGAFCIEIEATEAKPAAINQKQKVILSAMFAQMGRSERSWVFKYGVYIGFGIKLHLQRVVFQVGGQRREGLAQMALRPEFAFFYFMNNKPHRTSSFDR